MNNVFLSGGSHFELAKKISSLCSMPLVSYTAQKFADGEFHIEIQESVQNAHIYLFQSTCPPVNDHYMELFLLLDALKRENPAKINLIMPYYGYSRQDRRTSQGQPVSAQCIAFLLQQLGVNQAFFLDIHSSKILNFFNIPVQNISAHTLIAQKWNQLFSRQTAVCVSPDAGGRERVQLFAKLTKNQTAWIQKERTLPNQAQAMNLNGDVRNKNAVILDDMIDTAGTLCTAVDKLIENGAKDIFVIATHGLFSGPALSRIEKSPIQQVWVTDSVLLKPEALNCRKIKVFSCAELFSSAIKESRNN